MNTQTESFAEFRALINSNKYVILDTETTGLKRPAEIVQVAMLDFTGEVILNTLVKNTMDIPQVASDIHGIYAKDLVSAPPWHEVKRQILDLSEGLAIITYNSTYDRSMFHCSDEANGLDKTDYHSLNKWHCAMNWYSQFWNQIHPYYGTAVWQKLTVACSQQSVSQDGIVAHSAAGDCILTYRLIKTIIANTARNEVLSQLE